LILFLLQLLFGEGVEGRLLITLATPSISALGVVSSLGAKVGAEYPGSAFQDFPTELATPHPCHQMFSFICFRPT
jgi:hypothetical protein